MSLSRFFFSIMIYLYFEEKALNQIKIYYLGFSSCQGTSLLLLFTLHIVIMYIILQLSQS